jgi:hypothetical protein
MNENRLLKVFLVHASSDKHQVRALYERLTNDGIDAWLDSERLLPGQSWEAEIPKALQASDVVIVCLSNNTVNKEGFVQKEIKFALDKSMEQSEGSIFLIPLRLEECKVPLILSRYQWVDLFVKSGYEKLIRTLRLRASQVGVSEEAIQTQGAYWQPTLEDIRSAATLETIAETNSSLKLIPTDASNDLRNLLINVELLRQYARAALNSETQYNRREQLEKALDITKVLHKYFDAIPPWRFPKEIQPALEKWQNIFELEIAKGEREPIPNVYIAGSPLSENSKVFKGRKDIFRILEQELATDAEQRPALFLFGARRTGKTSVLRQLPDVLGPRVIPVMIDLQSMALTNNASTFLEKLSGHITKSALASRSIKLPEISRKNMQSDPYMVFADWLSNVEMAIRNRWLLLCFDEYEYFEKIVSDGRADQRIFQLLRSILQNYSNVTLLFSGAHTFDELESVWSHYLINVRTIKIGQLGDSEARELIEMPIEQFPLKYTNSAVLRILSAVSGQPYLLQATCRDLVNIMNDQGRLSVKDTDVELALNSVLTTGSAYFKELWSGPDSDEKQRAIMIEIAKKKNQPLSEDVVRQVGGVNAMRILVNHDVIEKTKDGYCFKVELVRRWVEQRI